MNDLSKPLFFKYRDQLILFVYPLLLVSINSNWIFTPATNYLPDPWFYLSYFRYFDTYAPAFPSFLYSYFVERLTWNIPSFYIYQLFAPLHANYILHLSVYYVAVFSLYGTLKLLFDRRTALISSLLMGSYPWFLRAVGWDYTDGTGIAHMLLLLYILTLVHYSEKHRLWLMLAGVVYSSLLITNLFWVAYSPSWAAYFLVLNFYTKKFRLEQMILVAAYFLIGTLLPITLSGLYYYQVTGDFVFFKNTLMAAISLSDDTTNEKSVRFIYGHMRPYWHVLPAVLALVSTWRLSSSQKDRKSSGFIAVYVLFLFAYGWLIVWHLRSTPLLIMFTYSSFVMPAIFLLLGATMSGAFDHLSTARFEVVVAGTIVLLALPLALVTLLPAIAKLQGNLVLIGVLAFILVMLFIVPKLRESSLLMICTLTLVFYFVGEKAFVYVPDRQKGKDHYLAIISASDAIDQRFPDRQYDDVRLWFHADENYDTFFSLGGLYLYPWGSVIGYRNSREDPPTNFSLRKRDEFDQGDHIVILSSRSDLHELLNDANHTLASKNAKVELEASKTIQQGSVRFFLYFTTVSILP